MTKKRLLYFTVLLIIIAGFWFINSNGISIEKINPKLNFSSDISGIKSISNTNSVSTSVFPALISEIFQNIKHPLSILLLQIISIIITARVLGFLFRKMGQPTVIGEIIAGIVLGLWDPMSLKTFPAFLPKTLLGMMLFFLLQWENTFL